MQQKSTPPRPKQPTLPFEIPRKTEPRTEQTTAADRCSPEETWQKLDTQGREQLSQTWVRVLKEVVGDAQDR